VSLHAVDTVRALNLRIAQLEMLVKRNSQLKDVGDVHGGDGNAPSHWEHSDGTAPSVQAQSLGNSSDLPSRRQMGAVPRLPVPAHTLTALRFDSCAAVRHLLVIMPVQLFVIPHMPIRSSHA
jgi:hypothetical protein